MKDFVLKVLAVIGSAVVFFFFGMGLRAVVDFIGG